MVSLLYEVEQYDEIFKVIRQKINAEDMDNRVLAIYAVLAAKRGEEGEAVKLFERSLNNGFRWDRFRNFEKPLLTETWISWKTLLNLSGAISYVRIIRQIPALTFSNEYPFP